MAKRRITSRKGLFGITYHYDESGRQIGKSRPGLFGDNDVHFDGNGRKAGVSRPGLFSNRVHHVGNRYISSNEGLFSIFHRSNGKTIGKTRKGFFGTEYIDIECDESEELYFEDEYCDYDDCDEFDDEEM